MDKIALISPEVYILIAGYFLFNYQHNKALNNLKQIHTESINTIKESYKDASEQLRENFKMLNDIYNSTYANKKEGE